MHGRRGREAGVAHARRLATDLTAGDAHVNAISSGGIAVVVDAITGLDSGRIHSQATVVTIAATEQVRSKRNAAAA